MKAMKIIAFAAAAALCIASGAAQAADDVREFEVLVDPGMNPAELPTAPSETDRMALLRTLEASHPICPEGEDHGTWRANLFRSIDALRLSGSPVEGMAHIAMTERRISGSLLKLVVEYLASRSTPQADARVVQIYRAAPIIAKRMVPDGIDPAIRPLAENSAVIDIRSTAERTARTEGSRALAKALGSSR